MIGSIISAVKGHFKDTANMTRNYGLESAKDKKSKDIEKSVEKAQEKVEQEANNKVEEPQNTSEQTTQESTNETTEGTNVGAEVGGNTDEDKDNNSGTKVGGIISDENLKDVTAESGDNAKPLTSDQNGEDTPKHKLGAGQIMSIIQGVRRDLQNVGKSIQGKNDGSEPVGSNTAKAAYNVYMQQKRPQQYVAEVPSDECLKRFFYDEDESNRGFYDSDILEAYKNLDAIKFTYTEEATELDPTQDTETVHVGLKAQDIEAQPELASAVKEDPESGYKVVDTREMTMSNAAAISELTKLVEELKQKIESLGG